MGFKPISVAGACAATVALSAGLVGAGLLGAGLVVTGVDDAMAVMPQLLTILTDSAVPVIVVDRMRWPAEWTSVVPLTVAAPVLDRD